MTASDGSKLSHGQSGKQTTLDPSLGREEEAVAGREQNKLPLAPGPQSHRSIWAALVGEGLNGRCVRSSQTARTRA